MLGVKTISHVGVVKRMRFYEPRLGGGAFGWGLLEVSEG